MSKQAERLEYNILPLRALDQLRENEERKNTSTKSHVNNSLRSSPRSRLKMADAWKGDFKYEVLGEASYWDALETVRGEKELVSENIVDKNGNMKSSEPFDGNCELDRFLEYFFLEDEVEEAYRLDATLGGDSVWTESYWLAGYSDFENRSFGPGDIFEGPVLKYARVSYVDDSEDSVFPGSSIGAFHVHPQHKLDQYTENGETVHDILKEGYEQL